MWPAVSSGGSGMPGQGSDAVRRHVGAPRVSVLPIRRMDVADCTAGPALVQRRMRGERGSRHLQDQGINTSVSFFMPKSKFSNWNLISFPLIFLHVWVLRAHRFSWGFFCRHRRIALLGVNPKRSSQRDALFLAFDRAMPIATVHQNWFVLGGLVFDPDD